MRISTKTPEKAAPTKAANPDLTRTKIVFQSGKVMTLEQLIKIIKENL